ncbi:NAD(P)-dependent oxidoreductase [Sinorhizobium meliloti]|nr:NAD(P)-dependent oxidoreductase [Sinorhizobium meliloti]
MPAKSPVIVDLKFIPEEVEAALAGAFPGREVIDLADPAHQERDLSGIDYAVVWKSAPDLFSRAPDLKVVFSGGAGVDHVLTLPGLPDVPLVRFVDRTLTTRMSEWVVMQCLLHLRQHRAYEALGKKHEWRDLSQPEAADVTVGIMGMGVLGQDAARKLAMMGFKVIGWSRSKRVIEGVETYDAAGLDAFLGRTDFLVGLLPLTPDTRGIFNAALFAKLSRNGPFGAPVFINAGRGGSQVEADILECLDSRCPGRRLARCLRTGAALPGKPLLGHAERLCDAACRRLVRRQGALRACGAPDRALRERAAPGACSG